MGARVTGEGAVITLTTTYGTEEDFARVLSSMSDARELVRRWNAFEPSGAVALAVEALRVIEDWIDGWAESRLDTIQSVIHPYAVMGGLRHGSPRTGVVMNGFEVLAAARAALRALTEEASQ